MITVEALSVSYGQAAPALKSTTLSFERGAFTVLLGASGAGKSTLLRALNGLVKPTSGKVVTADFGPLSSGANLRSHRRRTGMIFQQHQLIGRSSVLENVLMGRLGYHNSLRTLFPFGRDERLRALSAIERVGLIEYALRRADQLSGGQQQRVGIARALVQQPDIILADEPVASLDPATAEAVLSLIHGIAKQDGLTAVVSLHQLDFARRFADRIIGLAHGEVVFDGKPTDLSELDITRLYQTAPMVGAAKNLDHSAMELVA
ncbi:phosphonate ABC transporter ATP-binding protein [Phreatobacter sp.]|uniref:phosphonate ABC transporter ATP-binding protein n=1 Tax=Phreatobacter sp. TaxID=1966341 RepID=UPI003523DA81